MKKLEKISISDMDKVIKNQRNYQKLLEVYQSIEEIEFKLDETCIDFSLADINCFDENGDRVVMEIDINVVLQDIKDHIFNIEMFRIQIENNKILGIK